MVTPLCQRRASPLRASAALVAALILVPAAGLAELRLTDAAGRQVVLPEPARHLALSEADLILSLALITPDPVTPVAAWGSPHRLDPGIRDALAARFPDLAAIPEAGSATPSDYAVEAVVALEPDLAVIRVFDPAWQQVEARLTAADIPLIYLEGPETADLPPAEQISFAVELLGDAIGAGDRARDYTGFVRDHYARIAELVAGVGMRPAVLVDGHATPDCCWVPGRDNRLGQLVEFAGGEIVGSEMVTGYAGQLAPEYLLAADPQVMIATGGPHLARSGGLVMGLDIAPEDAARSLQAVIDGSARAELRAVQDERAHGLLHLLTITPLDVLAVELFAGWIHPEIADQLDPAATLAEINARFMPITLNGALWTDLPETE
ncbi:ABC transporter substrate-binding protein [Paracoccus caeni]|uniref:ABC transporter substrate-binding protein n=1 Tax=Paracoccus caeni TaxID=657651 RepID=A0A934VZB5_9RHOB|nr:ABC transporter substrate-binding protein [Paracoccus caeni]MBK4215118.1 ABC transporter substrate-binding protein [Paracoccus caeni]